MTYRIETTKAETNAAMNEFDEMMKTPQVYKRYSTFKEAMREVLEEEESEENLHGSFDSIDELRKALEE